MVNSIISSFWALVGHEAWFPAFQYVTSHLNLSDPISRHQTDFAARLGWEELEVDDSHVL